MKKHDVLLKKMRRYSALAGATFMYATAAEAQIIYQDLTPDYSQGGGGQSGSYDLDLNNDGIVDFTFENHFNLTNINQHSSTYASSIVLKPYPGNSAGLHPLDTGSLVDADLNGWFAGAFTLAAQVQIADEFGTSFLYGGEWRGISEKFLGVRLVYDGESHYGWIRLSINNHANNFTLFDYAYESTPDSSILAGEITYYADVDGDSYGDPNSSINSYEPVTGCVLDNTDCFDRNPNVNPGAIEVPNNGIDDNCDGVDEVEFEFSLFPNPSQKIVTAHVALVQKANVRIVVCNVSGREILTLLEDQLEEGEHSLHLNTSQLSTGVYIAKLVTENMIEERKLVIE